MARRTITAWIALALVACEQSRKPDAPVGSGPERLRPVTAMSPGIEARQHQTVYVPVYSSIYLGGPAYPESTTPLTATVSFRNVSPRHAIVLHSVRYYDSAGQHVRDFRAPAGELPPLASVEWVVTRADTGGGPGANFLIEWSGPEDVDPPAVEAVMMGQRGNAGIAFTSPGRTLRTPAPASPTPLP